MISLSILFTISYEGNINNFLPLLAGYTYALFKLIPSFQSIYANLANIRGNIYSLKNIYKEILRSNKKNQNSIREINSTIEFKNSIKFEKVSPLSVKETSFLK